MSRRGRSPTRTYITESYLHRYNIEWDPKHGINYAQKISRATRLVDPTPENELLFNEIKKSYKRFNPSPWGDSKEALKRLRDQIRRRKRGKKM